MNYLDKLNNLQDSEYIPHPWLLNKHVATMLTAILPNHNPLAKMTNEAYLIPVDEESLVLAHAHINENVHRCLIIIHGLEGDSSSPYVLYLTAHAIASGFNVVRLNLRNCGNTMHFTPTLYNAGQSNDLLQVINWLAEKKGQTEQYLVGYSLGGNIVMKALAELNGSHQFIKAASAVCPSIDLAASVDQLEKGINRIYEYYFLRRLKNKIIFKHKLFPERYDLKKLAKVNSLRAFDNFFTAPDAGYKDGAEYYRQASAMYLIDKIKTQTLLIATQNDPIIPFESFSRIDNPHINVLAPKHGGHVGFIIAENKSAQERKIPLWADRQILSFFLKQKSI